MISSFSPLVLVLVLVLVLPPPPCDSLQFQSFLGRSVAPRTATSLHSLPTQLDTATSGLASMARLMRGVTVEVEGRGPVKGDGATGETTLTLWDSEHDPGCRTVREEITRLDLCCVVKPCAMGSRHWADLSDGGAAVPCLADSASGVVLHGSESVLSYLRSEYGGSSSSSGGQQQEEGGDSLQPPPAFLSYVASALRFNRGATVSAAAAGAPRPEEEPLVLYSYEGNQFCRLVRETMAELDLPYELRSAGKGSPRREAEMVPLTGGSSQCPYLVDPNTGAKMAESLDIVAYLYRTYALWTPPSGLLRSFNGFTAVLKPIFAAQARTQAAAAAAASAASAAGGDEGEGEGGGGYDSDGAVRRDLEATILRSPVVVFTYELSPFCLEATNLLAGLDYVEAAGGFVEVSLGKEWAPGFIDDDGPASGAVKRGVLLDMTGQSSLPHVFVGGRSVGGLFSGGADGASGLVPSLEAGDFKRLVEEASAKRYTKQQ
jgi:glutaredoxin